MMRGKIFLILFAFWLIFFTLTQPGVAKADFQLTQGQVQLSVADILLDVEGSQSIIDEMAFYGSYFTVTVSASQQITIISADKRDLEVSPTTYSSWFSITCNDNNSKVTIQTPSSLIGSVTFTITPKSTTCMLGGGDGGGPGGTGTPTGPTPPPPPPPPPPPFPPGEPFPGELPLPPILKPFEPILRPFEPLIPKIPKIPEVPPPEEPEIPPTPPPITKPVIEAIKEIITPAPETVKGAQEITKGVIEIIKVAGDRTAITTIVEKLRADPTVIGVIKNTIQPLVITFGVLGLSLLTVTAVQASATLAIQSTALLQFLDISRFLTIGIIPFKKRNPWGRVIERVTKKPVPAVLVQVYDAEFKKLKDSQLTDKEGRFGSLVGAGKYFIKVSKDGFQDKETETITISQPKQVLNLEIIIAPIEQEPALAYLKKVNLLDVLKRLLDTISPALLIIGTILSIVALVILPTVLNYAIFTIYILLDILKICFAIFLVKPFGKVLDAATFQPLPLAIIRIFDDEKQVLLSTRATDEVGRFNFLVSPGRYYLTCVKSGYLAFRSDPIAYTKAGLETADIKLQKIAPNSGSRAMPLAPPPSPAGAGFGGQSPPAREGGLSPSEALREGGPASPPPSPLPPAGGPPSQPKML